MTASASQGTSETATALSSATSPTQTATSPATSPAMSPAGATASGSPSASPSTLASSGVTALVSRTAGASGYATPPATSSPLPIVQVALSVTLPGMAPSNLAARAAAVGSAAAVRAWCELRAGLASAAGVPTYAVDITALRLGGQPGTLLSGPALLACSRRLAGADDDDSTDSSSRNSALAAPRGLQAPIDQLVAYATVGGTNSSAIRDGLLRVFGQPTALNATLQASCAASCAAFNISAANCPSAWVAMRLTLLAEAVLAPADGDAQPIKAAGSAAPPSSTPVIAGAGGVGGFLVLLAAISLVYRRRRGGVSDAAVSLPGKPAHQPLGELAKGRSRVSAVLLPLPVDVDRAPRQSVLPAAQQVPHSAAAFQVHDDGLFAMVNPLAGKAGGGTDGVRRTFSTRLALSA